MSDPLIGLDEAARQLGVSRDTVLRWLRAGTLEGVRLGPSSHARYRVRESVLEQFTRPAKRPGILA